jgi:hypothetical protein
MRKLTLLEVGVFHGAIVLIANAQMDQLHEAK